MFPFHKPHFNSKYILISMNIDGQDRWPGNRKEGYVGYRIGSVLKDGIVA